MKNFESIAQNCAIISPIGLYNQAVINNLNHIKLSEIEQTAIKIFKDTAQRNKLNQTNYNKEVEAFNDKYGLLILKKGGTQQAKVQQYNYINYPYLDSSAIKNSMDNYRKYVFDYNNKVAKENVLIAGYNKNIVATDSQKLKNKISNFKKENNKEFTRNYNQLVEQFNTQENANYLPKKRNAKVKARSPQIGDT